MPHFEENELIKSIVHIADNSISPRNGMYVSHFCTKCNHTVLLDKLLFCSECIFNSRKHLKEKTNLAQINQVLSRLGKKR